MVGQTVLQKNTATAYSTQRPLDCRFTSVQDGIYALGKAHMRYTLSLRSLLQCCLENSSKVGLTEGWPFLVLSPQIAKCCLFPRVSPPGDRWRDFHGFMPAGRVSRPATLQIFRDGIHVLLLLCPLFCRLKSFPLTPACHPGRVVHPQEFSKTDKPDNTGHYDHILIREKDKECSPKVLSFQKGGLPEIASWS